jgi:Alpha/beta hydrolase family
MPKSPAHLFYNDLPDATAQHWVQKLLPSHLGTPQTLTYEGWRHVPAFYLFCEYDNALSLKLQESMVAKAKAYGADILTEKFNSGHSPFLSMPEATAKWVERSVSEAEKLAGI